MEMTDASGQTDQEAGDEDLLDELYDEETEDMPVVSDVPDPLYHFNYAMYAVNDCLYFMVLKPASEGYKALAPEPVRLGVRNFFHNLLFPVRLVNNLLQGRAQDAGDEVQIFLINSTEGLLGLMQPAQEKYGFTTADEDLGQTLGTYQLSEGFYLVLPVLGPSSLRDAVGMVGDSFLKPVNYVEPWELSTGMTALDTVNAASFRVGDYEMLKKSAVDFYQAQKNAYIQNRRHKISE
ncbi:MAG: VacJ family lipoprotein [Desulfobacteraceae bacterium]|nr:MAG: VacJ family lipoprotein [Desulfobacteraceae bacterium]